MPPCASAAASVGRRPSAPYGRPKRMCERTAVAEAEAPKGATETSEEKKL